MPVERSLVQRAIEWLAPWYDAAADDARSKAVELAVADAKRSTANARIAIRDHRDEVRESFRRANERLGSR